MDLHLTGKVAIVSGASRGIGRSITSLLADEGMRVVLVARTEAALAEVARTLSTEHLVVAADLRKPEAPAAVVAAAVARFGQLDVLVNNAGATKRGDFLELTDEDWADGFALKLFGAMRLCRAAWPHLQRTRGCIVNVIGIGGRTGSAEFAIGGSVNAALMNLTKVLADRGVTDGVRVNAVNPGSVATDRLLSRIAAFARTKGITEAVAAEQMAAEMGIARFGRPAEIARVVAFLASGAAEYVQGAIVDADGGATRTL